MLSGVDCFMNLKISVLSMLPNSATLFELHTAYALEEDLGSRT